MPNRSNHLKTGKHMMGVFNEAILKEIWKLSIKKEGWSVSSECSYFAWYTHLYTFSYIYN